MPEYEQKSLEQVLKELDSYDEEARTFNKAPKWEPDENDMILFRISRKHIGIYKEPLVISDEWAILDGSVLGPMQTTDLRIPSYLVRRAVEKKVVLEEGLVYIAKFLGTKASRFDSPTMLGYIRLVGDSFPK